MQHGQKPTETEYAILRILWELGPSTVKDVHLVMQKSKEIGYTSVLKTMQVMAEKGLVLRNEDERAHVYTPAFSEAEAQGNLLTDMLHRVFGGSSQNLVMRALQVRPTSKEERDEIRKLLDEMGKEN